MWKYCMLATAGLALMAFTGCETAERVSAEAKTTTDRVLDRVLGEAACEGARADRARIVAAALETRTTEDEQRRIDDVLYRLAVMHESGAPDSALVLVRVEATATVAAVMIEAAKRRGIDVREADGFAGKLGVAMGAATALGFDIPAARAQIEAANAACPQA